MIASRFWPFAIVGLLVLNAVIVGITVVLARSGAPAVEQDYYQRAVRWDEYAALRQASTALGWQARMTLELERTAASSESDGTLRLQLTDRAGLPVLGAHVTARVFHGAHADLPRDVELTAVSPGVYEAPIGPAHQGIWQASLVARRGDDTFLLDRSVSTASKEPAQ